MASAICRLFITQHNNPSHYFNRSASAKKFKKAAPISRCGFPPNFNPKLTTAARFSSPDHSTRQHRRMRSLALLSTSLRRRLGPSTVPSISSKNLCQPNSSKSSGRGWLGFRRNAHWPPGPTTNPTLRRYRRSSQRDSSLDPARRRAKPLLAPELPRSGFSTRHRSPSPRCKRPTASPTRAPHPSHYFCSSSPTATPLALHPKHSTKSAPP